MTDIVERLRFRFTDPAKVRGILVNPDGPEAANEIERLREDRDSLIARIFTLSEALKTISETKHHTGFMVCTIHEECVDMARAALEAPQERMAKPLEGK